MAFEGNQQSKLVGLLAASDLSASQYCFCELDSSGNVTICNATGEQSIGVLQNKPAAASRAAEISGLIGTSKVKAGAALATLGAYVMTDTSGRAIPVTSGKFRLGIVRSTAANANELATIELGQFGLEP